MSTRRRAAAAAAPAATPLDGCVVALSGKFSPFGYDQGTFEGLVRKLGGSVTRSVTAKTTHVVCTQADYEGNTTKVAAGKNANLQLVGPEWVLDCEKDAKKHDEVSYSWTAKPAAKQPAANGTKANGTANGTANGSGKKRPIAVAKDDDADQPEPKKTKGKKANGTKAKGKADDDDAKQDDAKQADAAKEEEVKEEKHAAEGQFVKKKGVSILRDGYCHLTDYDVYIGDDGMIWDASLNQSNSGRNNNKFYRLQVSHSYKHYASLYMLTLDLADSLQHKDKGLQDMDKVGACW